jgi:phosphopantetheine adenylyltransferase
MIIIAIIISIFFIVVIAILCKSYTKDIFELENRVLQLEKRLTDDYKNVSRQIIELQDLYVKDGDTMACKKGRGGRKK